MLTTVNHVSHFDTASWVVNTLWLVMATGTLGVGARMFRHMAYLPACWKRGPWYLMAYGLTGYGVGRIGWLFSETSNADHTWVPILYACSGMALLGGAWACERVLIRISSLNR
jgi:hypothetical protein